MHKSTFTSYYDIYYSLDEEFETRPIFVDISKTFDIIWHEWTIYELRQYCSSSDLLSLLIDFLINKKQRVVLNGQHSSWADIKAGVSQREILRAIFLLI